MRLWLFMSVLAIFDNPLATPFPPLAQMTHCLQC